MVILRAVTVFRLVPVDVAQRFTRTSVFRVKESDISPPPQKKPVFSLQNIHRQRNLTSHVLLRSKVAKACIQ